MKQFLPKKLILMPSIARFALVLIAAIALLLMATPGAFAASAHPAVRRGSGSDLHGKTVRQMPNDCSPGYPRCVYLLLDGQTTPLHLDPNSNDCRPTNEFGNIYECDVTLSLYYQYGGTSVENWVATSTNLYYVSGGQLVKVHVSPSSGTLIPRQSVTVRIYPLDSLGTYNHGYVTFTGSGQWSLSTTIYWQE